MEYIDKDDSKINKVSTIFPTYQKLTDANNNDIFNTLLLKNNINSLEAFLCNKGWKKNWSLYFKWNLKIDTDHRSIIKPKNNIVWLEIVNRLNSWFWKIIIDKNLPIVTEWLDTFFVVSGIQAISKQLFEELSFDNNWHIISQPSIRLKYLDQISGVEGNWISFVNTNLYKVWCSFEEYLGKVDELITALSSIWLYAWNLSLEVSMADITWNSKQMKNIGLNISFGNLEIWEALYVYDFQQDTRENIVFADIGLWVERMVYARDRMNNYFEQFNVNLEQYKEKEIEIIKTLILMLSVDIRNMPKTNNAWLRYKKMIELLKKDKNYFPLIISFYGYWKDFLNHRLNIDTLLFSLLSDIEKYWN